MLRHTDSAWCKRGSRHVLFPKIAVVYVDYICLEHNNYYDDDIINFVPASLNCHKIMRLSDEIM